MGFVFERFFVYAEIDACENFPYVDAFETARIFFSFSWEQTIRNSFEYRYILF